MNHRLLKAQLFFFFLLTCVSFTAFYFHDALPDNSFSISSASQGTGVVSYTFFSMVASVGFYLGPWVFVPFLIFSLSFTFVYGLRERGWDFFAGPMIYISSGIIAFYATPEFVGRGMIHLFDRQFTDFALLTTAFIALLGFCYLTFERTFVIALYQGAVLLVRSPGAAWRAWSKFGLWGRIKSFYAQASRVFVLCRDRIRGLFQKKVQTDVPAKPAVAMRKPTVAPQIIETRPTETTREAKTDVSEISPVVKTPSAARPPKVVQEDASYSQMMNFFSDHQFNESGNEPNEDYFQDIIDRLHVKLEEFKIEGQIINVLKGPVVDTFELELGAGVKVAKLNSVQEDLSLALQGAPIRVVYPMKERTTVGIEVPRTPRDVILLHELLQSTDFSQSRYRLPVAMGKNAFGEPFVVDLAAMPHMLVAGSTGAGKSVFINTLLVSLLVQKSPRQMRLILIDPKQLELALYADLPHLVMPVITEPKRASIALLWAIQEMERRYTILKDAGVRDIESFNKKIRQAEPALLSKVHPHYENDPDEEGYELPYIVIVVDEFADIILTKMGKDIETAICRLAAKARASGIHLVVATQRPSVNVVTGLIKSNFPVRVSFRVTTIVDSRTILDGGGAEKLLGRGDMLYRHGVETTRAHSGFVDEMEIESLVERMSEFSGTYDEAAMRFLETGTSDSDEYSEATVSFGAGSFDGDDLYREAVKVVMESRAASASMLQRRLKIGYPRAANLIDELERKGVIGPAQGSKPRQVLGAESSP
jgi:DNA segregation ATPase FtsK/SpoIIIE, S-DNA-T family